MLLLSGCNAAIEEAVKRELNDVDSARFKGINKCSKDPSMFFGMVNSKNRMGGYDGFEVFFYDGSSAYLWGESDYSSQKFLEMSKKCHGQ